jgi:hypothetical protein
MDKQTLSTLKVKTPEAGPSLLERAIKRHQAAYAYFEATCYLSDDGVLGRDPTEDEKLIYSAASGLEEAALQEVCAFPVSSLADMTAKTAYILGRDTYTHGYLTDDQRDAFRASLVQKGGAA